MPKTKATKVITGISRVDAVIHKIRSQQVILAADLAKIYGVETRTLNQAVKRNANIFPGDFMFQLTQRETRRVTFKITKCDLEAREEHEVFAIRFY